MGLFPKCDVIRRKIRFLYVQAGRKDLKHVKSGPVVRTRQDLGNSVRHITQIRRASLEDMGCAIDSVDRRIILDELFVNFFGE